LKPVAIFKRTFDEAVCPVLSVDLDLGVLADRPVSIWGFLSERDFDLTANEKHADVQR